MKSGDTNPEEYEDHGVDLVKSVPYGHTFASYMKLFT
jgi:hypothetical protein